MAILNNRIIYSNNAVVSDLTIPLNDYNATPQVIEIVAAEDYLYLGSEFPFNHRYFDVSTVNTNASIVSVDYWDGTEWRAAVDVQDETSLAGASIGRSGIISWCPNKRYLWQRESTNYENETIDGLTDVVIYDLFWVRMKWSGDFSALTAMNYIGHRFATDNDVKKEYPDLLLADVFENFEAGKTNWNEQLIVASETIIKDLKAKNVIYSGNQVLDWRIFTSACVQKLSEIVFIAFGKDYTENTAKSESKYNAALKVGIPKVDLDGDAILSPQEQTFRTGVLYR